MSEYLSFCVSVCLSVRLFSLALMSHTKTVQDIEYTLHHTIEG